MLLFLGICSAILLRLEELKEQRYFIVFNDTAYRCTKKAFYEGYKDEIVYNGRKYRKVVHNYYMRRDYNTSSKRSFHTSNNNRIRAEVDPLKKTLNVK